MGLRFLKIAVVYLFAGAILGVIMGITQQFALASVHAHVLLLGWESLALAGIVYHLYPAAAATLPARIHFWLHNLGLPVFMIALGMLLAGHESAGPVVGISSGVVLVALAVFSVNVLVNVRPAA
jgi:cbb3-type cytochrome oxidase subunit 1